jgi:undecaprenyl-diphosphatase
VTVAPVLVSLNSLDHALMRRVHHWRAPRWVRWFMIAATRGGDGWLWLLCGLLLVAEGEGRGYRALEAGLLSAICGISLFRVLKSAVRRKRPCNIEPHCWSKLLPPDQFSFPSGHTLTAFAVAISLSSFYPGYAPILLICAASIAVSRIVLGMHFLTDVVAGAAIGTVIGMVSAAVVA